MPLRCRGTVFSWLSATFWFRRLVSGFCLRFGLSRPAIPTSQSVDGGGYNDHRPFDEPLVGGAQVKQVEAVRQREEDQRADKGLEHTPRAAEQRCSTQDGCR